MKPYHPMLAKSGNGTDPATLVGSHVFDLKLDGVRSLAHWDGTALTLINRSGREQTLSYPELITDHPFPDNLEVVLDGEIVATDGSFESVAKRDKQTKPLDVVAAMAKHPVKFVAFDMLRRGDQDMRVATWTNRRQAMEHVLVQHPSTLWEPSLYSPHFSMLDKVRELGLEGVIAKRVDSAYRTGRSGDWLKFKNTHRITCVAVGYESGTGSRAHFGAMYLALLDGNTVVQVGRVGTGFTVADTWACKQRLDEHRPFLVEIEVANVTQANQLRFPSFKGIRSDLSVSDATMEQLDGIPRS